MARKNSESTAQPLGETSHGVQVEEPGESSPEQAVAALREEVDAIDRQVVALGEKRQSIMAKIDELRIATQAERLSPAEEYQLYVQRSNEERARTAAQQEATVAAMQAAGVQLPEDISRRRAAMGAVGVNQRGMVVK